MYSGLKEYIIKVCKDSCLAEHHPVDVSFQYAIVEDMLVFAMRCPYKRVLGRINYRLGNNLRKNFGLVYCNVEDQYSRLDFLPGDIDPNFSFAEWQVFGKWGTLRIGEHEILNPHLHISARVGGIPTKYESLLSKGYIYSVIKDSECKEAWNKFCNCYEEAFGDRPYAIKETVSVQVR